MNTLGNLIKNWLAKLSCHHDWEILAKTEYTNGYRYLLACKKCGKIKTKQV